ncbi:MAG: lytic transglycosylase domain-containing protein [Rhodoferax sp.]|nr:lytic transglycosylase domain-containing protein [Rhodoferax sp.]
MWLIKKNVAAWVCILAVALPCYAARAQAVDVARNDQAVLDMAQAFKLGDRKQLTQLLPQAKGSLLEPWAAYWEMAVRLDQADKADIESMLARYAGSYQEDRLRAEWLLQLGRNRDWATFRAQLPLYRMADERSIQCYALWSDYLSSGADVAKQLQELWLAQREPDEACADAAQELIKARNMPAQAAWLRARLGMENDRLKVTTQAVATLDSKWVKTVAAIYQSPASYLNDKLTALRPQTREFVSLALIRLAYLEPQEAALEVDKLRWRAQLTAEERSWIWGVIGKRAAQKSQDNALSYYQKGRLDQMHEDQVLWALRAALRAGQWAQVEAAFAALPPAVRADATWVYWHARAVLAQKPSEVARAQALASLQSIAGIRGFYEQLALEELGQRSVLPAKPVPPTLEEKEAARKNPGLQRALHAMALGLRSDGVREWNYSISLHTKGGMDDRSLLAAAELACHAEVWDRCINTSERSKVLIDMEQRFPMPFKAAVLARAQSIGLEPAYVYGLIRQESRFIMDARSVVGASGLMQVMPATAKWTAKKIGLIDFTPAKLTDRDTNIAIGTGYLKLVLDSFQGSMPLAAAAYNAGPSRARTWRGASGAPVLEAAIWAENIPFNETRDYVKKVLSNTALYAAMISGQPQSIKARLGSVGPLDAIAPETGLDLP